VHFILKTTRSWRRSKLVSTNVSLSPGVIKRRDRKLRVPSRVRRLVLFFLVKLLISHSVIDVNAGLDHSRALLDEYDEHIKALENGEEFVPRLTANNAPMEPVVHGKKRKSLGGGKKGSTKRRRSEGIENEDEEMGSVVDIDSEVDSHSGLDSDSEADGESDVDNDSDSGSDAIDDGEEDGDKSNSDNSSESGSDSNADDDAHVEQEQKVTVESLKAKMEEVKLTIKNYRDHLTEVKKNRKDAADALSALKERQLKAQKDKNAFCSLKRSEVRGWSTGAIRIGFDI
jgi:hypothetical protein